MDVQEPDSFLGRFCRRSFRGSTCRRSRQKQCSSGVQRNKGDSSISSPWFYETYTSGAVPAEYDTAVARCGQSGLSASFSRQSRSADEDNGEVQVCKRCFQPFWSYATRGVRKRTFTLCFKEAYQRAETRETRGRRLGGR